jgi:hypothetical protein
MGEHSIVDSPADGIAVEHNAPDEVSVVEGDENLLLLAGFEWTADASLAVHTIEENMIVSWGPNADEMWELGKLCSERIGLTLKVNRVARRHGWDLERRFCDPERHFLLGGSKAKSWHEAIVFEATVGPFYRLFFESFFRSSDSQLDALVRDLWQDSQRFIRFGQARVGLAMSQGQESDIAEAVEKWLPAALGALSEVPDSLDEAWQASGIRTRTANEVRKDYLEEIATYLKGNELEVPERLRDAVCEAEVNWVGTEVAGGGRRGGPVQPATFAFSDRLRGQRPDSAQPDQPAD